MIDEYDTPIQQAYLHGYYNDIVPFIRNLFSAALKDNDCLYKGVLTGILRVSKESLFSGLNNVIIYSLLDDKYANHFGFLEEEVNYLIEQLDGAFDKNLIKDWYNGYKFGDKIIYNPWSIINCLKKEGNIKSYWINTSENKVIKAKIMNSEPPTKEKLQILMQGGSISEAIDENIVFQDLDTNVSALWSLLLMSGYLKAKSYAGTLGGDMCELEIPNKEVGSVYIKVINEWLSGVRGVDWYKKFLDDLVSGRVNEFEQKLQTMIDEVLSYHDTSKKSQESFYHGLMLGFISGLNETHEVKSNRESGKGRYDVAVIPRDIQKLGLVLEFKAVDNENMLNDIANTALAQIKNSKYNAELSKKGINKILGLGIAFSGKKVKIISDFI